MSSLIDSMYLAAKRRLERDIDYHTRVQLLGFKERCSRYVIASYSMPVPNGWPRGQLVAHNVFSIPRDLVAGSEVHITVGGGGGGGTVTAQGGAGGTCVSAENVRVTLGGSKYVPRCLDEAGGEY